MENLDSAGTSLFLARRSFNVKTKQNKKQRQEEEEEKNISKLSCLRVLFCSEVQVKTKNWTKKKKPLLLIFSLLSLKKETED